MRLLWKSKGPPKPRSSGGSSSDEPSSPSSPTTNINPTGGGGKDTMVWRSPSSMDSGPGRILTDDQLRKSCGVSDISDFVAEMKRRRLTAQVESVASLMAASAAAEAALAPPTAVDGKRPSVAWRRTSSMQAHLDEPPDIGSLSIPLAAWSGSLEARANESSAVDAIEAVDAEADTVEDAAIKAALKQAAGLVTHPVSVTQPISDAPQRRATMPAALRASKPRRGSRSEANGRDAGIRCPESSLQDFQFSSYLSAGDDDEAPKASSMKGFVSSRPQQRASMSSFEHGGCADRSGYRARLADEPADSFLRHFYLPMRKLQHMASEVGRRRRSERADSSFADSVLKDTGATGTALRVAEEAALSAAEAAAGVFMRAEEYIDLLQRIDKLTLAHDEVTATRKREALEIGELRAAYERKHGEQMGAALGVTLSQEPLVC